MIPLFHYLKLVQLVLVAWWCARYKPTKLWVLVLCAIPLLSMFIPGSFESGDFTTHIVRAMDLLSSLQQGIFPVRWAWQLHGGYGYPLFNFVSTLPYYQLAVERMIGIPFVVSMKLYLSFWYLLCSLSMFLLAKTLWKNDHTAALSAVLYGFAPYMLINLNFRAAVGELGGFALLPLILFAVLRKRTMLFSITTALLFLMHPGVTLLGMPFMLLLIVFKKQVRTFFLPLLLAGGLAAWYLVPAVLEAQFTEQVYHTSQNIWNTSVFPPLLQLLWSPWRGGFLFQGHRGELAYVTSLFSWTAIVFSMTFLWKKRVEKRFVYPVAFLLLVFVAGFFMLTPLSAQLWNVLPMIRKLQFPSRMMLLTVTSSALLAGYIFRRILKPHWIPLFLFVAVGWTALNWTHRAYKPEINDRFLQGHLALASFEYERLPEAIPKWKKDITEPRSGQGMTVAQGTVSYTSMDHKPTYRAYNVDVQSDTATLIENTMYFPGWRLLIDNSDAPIVISDRGLMQFSVQKGEHIVVFRFEDTPIRRNSNIVSIISVGILALWVIRKKYR